jgi:hypothetical protein
MLKCNLSLLATVAALLLTELNPANAAEKQTLWTIGKPDGNDAELAHAPKGYREIQNDAYFVVGRSEASQDWPYAQPGPGDNWAGSRPHTFTIVFGLQAIQAGQTCHLILDLLDTHNASPPGMKIAINGKAFEHAMPPGAGDDSLHGDPAKGRKHTWDLSFDGGLLRAGENEITITSSSGSWIIYDAVRLDTPADLQLKPVSNATRLMNITVPPVWLSENGKALQPLKATLRHVGENQEITVSLDGQEATKVVLKNGVQTIDLKAPATEQPHTVVLRLTAGGRELAATNVALRPPPIRDMWILPHSHVDIGYTHRQQDIIDIQITNLETGLRLAQATAANPPGMRFKWNPEAVWSLDHFLQRATPEKRAEFIQGVRRGDVGVDALYGNMLTALCRPEELVQCLAVGARVSNLTGVPLETAAICDVPGYTWGIVPIMAQAGVKYFAIGPNYGDRVGTIHLWDDKPFYWKSQSGGERVLCWVVDNYHHLGDLEENVINQVQRLERSRFPYDTSFIFWVGAWPGGGVDNAPPDEKIVEKAMAWNAKYAAPKIQIGLVREFFRDFERKHGTRLPEFAGDLTPYWEDGAGSTARETAMNRGSADRLAQASTLFAMRNPRGNPTAQFDEAWKNVLLYSEHTWGAWCSISKPDDAFTLDQWKVKGGFAEEADRNSRALLKAALPSGTGATEIDVYNTTQWERTDLAMVPQEMGGESVVDQHGRSVPCQRLASGELAFLASEVPPFGAKRFRLSIHPASGQGKATAIGLTLRTPLLTAEVDPASGAIKSLRLTGSKHEYVDAQAPVGLNDYRYVLGTDSKGARSNGPVRIQVLENGPLVASLRITSDAPGCNQLLREVRVVDGLDRVELVNHVDRKSVREKDGVHFGFGFNVPAGTVRMETPWAVVRPNTDQLTGSCRNWFTVQRWVDISNPDCGITWAPLDAPLMEIGGLTANLLGSVGFNEWMTNALESQTIYSWAQNNHWHTNYKIDQPGVTTFRYILRPHRGGYSAAKSARFGMETTRPLLVAAATDTKAPGTTLSVSNPGVLVETVKVSDDRKALIVRLFGVSGKAESATIAWKGMKPLAVSLTDLTEKPLASVGRAITVPAYGVVNVRAELR